MIGQVKLLRAMLIVTMAAMCYCFIEYAMLNGRLSNELAYGFSPLRFQAVSDIGDCRYLRSLLVIIILQVFFGLFALSLLSNITIQYVYPQH